MDTSNGILLCQDCHRCFDSNLVCIDPETQKLLISDALLDGDKEKKWVKLLGRAVRSGGGTWPSHELLQFRVDAVNAAKNTRNEKRGKSPFPCSLCGRSYKSKNRLEKHRQSCTSVNPPISTFTTPSKGTDNGGECEYDGVDDNDVEADVKTELQKKMGPG